MSSPIPNSNFDVVIALRIGGRDADPELVAKTFSTIHENIGTHRYRICVSTDPGLPEAVKLVLKTELTSPHCYRMHDKNLYWAEFINEAIRLADEWGTRYFIKAHDDIQLLTPDFIPTLDRLLSGKKDPIGWISFDDVGYRYGLWSPPSRIGWFKDIREESSWERKKAFQFHTWPEQWWRTSRWREWIHRTLERISNRISFFPAPPPLLISPSEEMLGNLDLPVGPVRCHAPWNMFVAIRMEVLRKIGFCENWKTYNALFVDEDWGLRSASMGYWNVWIPEIKYLHDRRKVWGGGNRSQNMIGRDHERVAEAFRKKWGFGVQASNEEIEKLKLTYAGTPLIWSIGRRSYEWDPVN